MTYLKEMQRVGGYSSYLSGVQKKIQKHGGSKVFI